MESLCIRNWDRWQSYRQDRGTPPWIKVHRNLFTNPDWATLSDSEKGQLVSLWIAAADNQGCIPDDCRVLRKICLLDEEPNINKFIKLGFIKQRLCQHNVNVTSTCQPSDAPEAEIEDKKTSSNYTMKFESFWERYPRKKGKDKAFASWKKYKCENGLYDRIMESLDEHIASKDWLRNGGQYIPHGSTWVSNKGWEDQPTEKGDGFE